ncbi:hypothetical protein A7K91_12125 [Paenibacillus oryzae]|uniref:Transglutaminase-like domain-containing protein n=1 Tax=Paenibacillus oryzae TaxID=1844972 RepID=A0A1A5YFU4_9BACL|nr:transglutaminase domain-containing protein [Paenibacillus oryzae]OBR64270.1 hypothetical protein A7K91_12125 [Paenibacillus oryzae]
MKAKHTARALCAILALVVMITFYSDPGAMTETASAASASSKKTVTFKDPQFEFEIRNQINKPKGQLYKSDLDKIYNLDIKNPDIQSIDGIEQLTGLNYLSLTDNQVTDLSPLTKVPDLLELTLSNLSNSNMKTVVPKLTKLNALSLWNFELTDISFLKPLTNLYSLDITNNKVTDISIIAGMKNLSTFSGGYNRIKDLTPLSKLPLRKMYMAGNEIVDLKPLSSIPTKNELYAIQLSNNKIEDLSFLSQFPNLVFLNVANNPVRSFLPVYPMIAKLAKKDFKLAEEDFGYALTIPDKGLEAAIREAANKPQGHLTIGDVNKIQTLNGAGRSIKSLEGLQYLPQLVGADLSNNSIKDLKPLKDLTLLRTLKLSGNPATNFKDIQDVIRGLSSRDFDPKLPFKKEITVNSFNELLKAVESGLDAPNSQLQIKVNNPKLHNAAVNHDMFSYMFMKYPTTYSTFTYISPTEVEESKLQFYIMASYGYKSYSGSVNLLSSTITFNVDKYVKPSTADNLKAEYDIQARHKEIVALSDEITKNASSDMDKLIAIHAWVTEHIEYDYATYNGAKSEPQDALSVLRNQYAVCEGYSNLTAALGRAAGIPTQVVSGYVSQYSSTWDQVLKRLKDNSNRHAWNQAYVDGRWIVLDTTWDAAQYSEGVRISEPTKLYFDPDPVYFASSHTFYAPRPTPDGLKEYFFKLNDKDEKSIRSLTWSDLWKNEGGAGTFSSFGVAGHMINGKATFQQAHRVPDGTYTVYTLSRDKNGNWFILKKEKKDSYLAPAPSYKLDTY